jgi:hypothetical protein
METRAAQRMLVRNNVDEEKIRQWSSKVDALDTVVAAQRKVRLLFCFFGVAVVMLLTITITIDKIQEQIIVGSSSACTCSSGSGVVVVVVGWFTIAQKRPAGQAVWRRRRRW